MLQSAKVRLEKEQGHILVIHDNALALQISIEFRSELEKPPVSPLLERQLGRISE